VSARFLVGVGAWLLGAAVATGGSLLAVSLLGQSLAPAGSQQLTSVAVNRALDSEAAEQARATPAPSPSPTASPTPARHHHKAKPSAPASPDPTAQPATTVLTSDGGSVVAECQPAGAYLVSWNANPGFQAFRVVRGPTATAKVTFNEWQRNRSVVMVISCANGAPSATISSHPIDE
jgi:serine/threonine-protein kinase